LTPSIVNRRRRRLLDCGVALGIAGASVLVGRVRAEERVLQLRIVGRKVVNAPATIRVKVRDRIELRWTTDEATTIHVHGYDIELALDPAAEGRMRFEANATGRYPISAHGFGAGTGKASHREVVLLYLEVHPE
jgi:hypothetical protein